MPGGRPPKGPDLVDRLEGSEEAKQRLKIVLETIQGKRTVREAMEILGISETRFHAIREKALSGAVSGLEPGVRGRPSSQGELSPEMEALARENERLKEALAREKVRADVAEILAGTDRSSEGEKKKTRARAGRRGGGSSRRSARRARKGGATAEVERRGAVGQREERVEDRKLRSRLLEYFWTMVKNGTKKAIAASWMGYPLRTLQAWRARRGSGGAASPPLGRRPKRGTAAQRNAVVATLNEYGPTLGVPSLHAKHPGMSRCELAEIKKRWLRILVKRYKLPIRVLHWTRPGTVWAMDYTEPGIPVDGVFEQILMVQDLPSSHPLEALPLPRKRGKMVSIALGRLFDAYGAPLVLKADNDSTFLVPEVMDLLEDRGVLLLLSPPRTPWYNGGVELCNRELKRLADCHARYHGRFECWSCDDVRKARDAIGDLRREGGLTRRETFASRPPIADSDRVSLRASFARLKPLVLEELLRKRGTSPKDNAPMRLSALQSEADRIALERALCENGLLFFQSRRVSPLHSADFRARIS